MLLPPPIFNVRINKLKNNDLNTLKKCSAVY